MLLSFAGRCRQHLNSLDLRFQAREDESAFIAWLELDVLRFGRICLCSVALLFFGSAVTLYMTANSTENDTLFWMLKINTSILSTFAGGIATLSYLRSKRAWFTTLHWEVVFSVAATLILVNFLTIGNMWTLPLFFGKHPDEVYRDDMRSSFLMTALSISLGVTIGCVCVPMRSCVRTLPLIVGGGTYVTMLHVAPIPFKYIDNVWFAVFVLSSIALAHQGARRNETLVRQKWLADRTVEKQQDEIKEQHAQVQGSSSLALSMRAVAESLCDIVVQLGHDCRVRSSGVKQNAFFRRDMYGHHIADLLSQQDKERFAALVAQTMASQVPGCTPITFNFDASKVEATVLVVNVAEAEFPLFLGVNVHRCETHLLDPPPGSEVEVSLRGVTVGRRSESLASSRKSSCRRSVRSYVPSSRSLSVISESSISLACSQHRGSVNSFRCTSFKARQASIGGLVGLWNVKRDPYSCCPWHSTLAAAAEAIAAHQNDLCMPLWAPTADWQCDNCGCMSTNEWGNFCIVCGSQDSRICQEMSSRPCLLDSLHFSTQATHTSL